MKRLGKTLLTAALTASMVTGCSFCPWRNSPDDFYIKEVLQKTRITVEEGGIEAAAATTMSLGVKSLEFSEPEKEFIANEPFKFYICTGAGNSEVLFCGQLCE